MNKELIKILKEHRRKLYPNGCPVPARGCGKTNLFLAHFLRYTAYDFVCNIYKDMDRKVSLEEAYRDMGEFIEKMMN